jgi:hypothetical protein
MAYYAHSVSGRPEEEWVTRMIVSCLIDADRAAAAAFNARATGEPIDDVAYPSVPALEAALHAWMARRGVRRAQRAA